MSATTPTSDLHEATRACLKQPLADLIAGEPITSGSGDGQIISTNPALPEQIVWAGGSDPAHVEKAVAAARTALPEWSATPIEQRMEVLRAYQTLAAERAELIGELICAETGKAIWDSISEAKLLAAKVDITLDDSQNSGRARVTGFDLELSKTRKGICRFRPHGVMAVVGPFNFPAHLPNGHIVPALLTGNTIVFKPSDKTPAVGQALAELFLEALDKAGAPAGVFNLVQGRADVASALVTHRGVDGVLFTGSWPVGRRILEANLDQPGKIIALEMGGNNPAIIMPDADLKQAAIECARAAFVTTGQRCTCTRRILVHQDIAKPFATLLAKIASNLIVGDPKGIGGGSRNQPVFMGPLISAESRDQAIKFQSGLASATTGNPQPILEMTAIDHPSGGHYVSPGIWQVDGFSLSDSVAEDAGADVELFGPMVRLAEFETLDEAIEQANTTRYGLAASIFTQDDEAIDRFVAESRAGCINVNTGTAGASGKLPFGGLGWSGNHRPAGAFSPDYCAYPIASMIEREPEVSLLPGMHYEESWHKPE
ncbi:MAG: aldehyde dehydrogenase family protein [Phycisphaerales bacterium JB050]